MSLGPENVKRTWQVRDGGMEYRMEVELGGYERVSAAMRVPGNCMELRMMPPEVIEHDLQSKIIGHIRSSLFSRP